MAAPAQRDNEPHKGWSPIDHVPHVEPDPLPEWEMEKVPLGRNRMLRVLAGATFGFAVNAAIKASPAFATCHQGIHANPPCTNQYYECCCCSSYYGCCNVGGGCVSYHSGCGPGGDGWYTCSGGYYYFCGDYYQPNLPSELPPCTCPILLATC